MLLTPQTTVPQVNVALLNEVVDESDQPAGWRLACARAREPLADVVALPMTTRLQLADMPNLRTRLQAAHHLAAELLALFGIDEQTLLKPDGTSGAAAWTGKVCWWTASMTWVACRASDRWLIRRPSQPFPTGGRR